MIFHTPVLYDAFYDHDRPPTSKSNGIISSAQLHKANRPNHVHSYSQPLEKMKRLEQKYSKHAIKCVGQ